MLKEGFVFLALTVLSLRASSQAIKVGQKVPDIIVKAAGGGLRGSFALSSLHKDLVLLDFWSFNCASCIMAFPRMEALQKKFGDRIQVLLVNRNKPQETEAFFKQRVRLRRPDLPFVSDARLSDLFPQNFNPWHVWLDSNLVVKYITVDYNATPENVERFLKGEPLYVTQLKYRSRPEKKDENDIYESFALGFDYYSSLTHFVYNGPHLGNYSGEKMNGKIRFSRCQATATSLLRDALIPRDKIRDFIAYNTIVLELPDTQNYRVPKDRNLKDQWYSEHYFNYDLVLPEDHEKDINKFVLDDVGRYFNLSARIETRPIQCLVLRQAYTGLKPGTKGGPSYDSLYMYDPKVITPYNQVRRMQNMPMTRLDDKMSETVPQFLDLSFVDSTHYIGNLDLEISGDAFDRFDLEAMNLDMARFGLQFVKEYCLRPVVVVSEKPNRR